MLHPDPDHSSAEAQLPGKLLSQADSHFLAEAAAYLEHPTLLIRLANLVGKPAEALLSVLPAKAHQIANKATMSALNVALNWALRTLPAGKAAGDEIPEPHASPPEAALVLSPRLHTALAATTGAVGGLFGLSGLAVEIPATVTVMLRSIAATAARAGANLDDPATRLECLAVLNLGSPAVEEMESAYFTSRIGMALAVHESAQFVTRHTAREVADAVARGTAPALVRLLGQIASRFEIVLSEKVAAQAVPLAGSVSGALINAAFTDHFNIVARYHFGILRLEAEHGREAVRAAYEAGRKK